MERTTWLSHAGNRSSSMNGGSWGASFGFALWQCTRSPSCYCLTGSSCNDHSGSPAGRSWSFAAAGLLATSLVGSSSALQCLSCGALTRSFPPTSLQRTYPRGGLPEGASYKCFNQNGLWVSMVAWDVSIDLAILLLPQCVSSTPTTLIC